MGAFDDLVPGQSAGAFDDLIPAKAKGSVGSDLLRQAGLTARYAVEGLSSLPNMLGDAVNKVLNDPGVILGAPPGALSSGLNLGMPSQATSNLLTQAGLPNAETPTERVVGGVSRALAGAGGQARGMAELPGELAAILASRTGMQAAGAASAGGASAAAGNAGASPFAQELIGMLAGVAGPAALGTGMSSLGVVARGAPRLLDPFTQGGRENIVGSTLSRLAANPSAAVNNLENVPTFVPGSKPTAAQASRDPGLLMAERSISSQDPQFSVRKSENNAARQRVLDSVAGTPDDLATAEQLRSETAAPKYEAAMADKPSNTPEVAATIKDLQSRPAFQEAVKRAVTMMRNEGDDVARQNQPSAPRSPPSVNPSQDDIVTAIRKLGGINPEGSQLASGVSRDFNFGPHPSQGPVWRRQGGTSPDTMADNLADLGYPVERGDEHGLFDLLADSHSGRTIVSNAFDHGAAQMAEDPLASSISRLTEQLAAKAAPKERPVDFAGSGVKLAHYTKLALDDMIEQATSRGQTNEARILLGVQKKLLGLVERPDYSPAYADARQTFAAQSKPVDQLTELQRIQKQAAFPGPDTTGESILSQAKWTNLVTKRIGELGNVLTPTQVNRLKAIGADLDRGSLSDTAGRAVGSNTFQNLSIANVIGAGMGGKMATNAIAQSLLRPLQWLYKIPEPQVRDLLSQAMLDPSLARAMMMKATPSNVEFIGAALLDKLRAQGQGSTAGAIAATQQ